MTDLHELRQKLIMTRGQNEAEIARLTQRNNTIDNYLRAIDASQSQQVAISENITRLFQQQMAGGARHADPIGNLLEALQTGNGEREHVEVLPTRRKRQSLLSGVREPVQQPVRKGKGAGRMSSADGFSHANWIVKTLAEKGKLVRTQLNQLWDATGRGKGIDQSLCHLNTAKIIKRDGKGNEATYELNVDADGVKMETNADVLAFLEKAKTRR